MIVNRIGLEAEFFLKKDGEYVLPANYGFGVDEFPLIGEIRAEPGDSRGLAIGQFYMVWINTLHKAREQGCTIEIPGYIEITPEQYADILRDMGSKELSTARNIHGQDILTMSDSVTKRGKMVAHRVSNGLHIHFSSEHQETHYNAYYRDSLIRVEVPSVSTNLYRLPDTNKGVTFKASRITTKDIWFIGTMMDKLLPRFRMKVKLKHRVPGHYECKMDGRVEYRSLPFTEKVLTELPEIVDYAFGLLQSLSDSHMPEYDTRPWWVG